MDGMAMRIAVVFAFKNMARRKVKV